MQELSYTYSVNGLDLRMIKDKYLSNGAVYFGLIDDATKELFCDITVNLNFSNERTIELDNDFRLFVNENTISEIKKDLNAIYLGEDYNGYCSFPVYYLQSKQSINHSE